MIQERNKCAQEMSKLLWLPSQQQVTGLSGMSFTLWDPESISRASFLNGGGVLSVPSLFDKE